MQLGEWQGGLNAQLVRESGRAPRPASAAAPKRKPRRG
jgi:hypothetical protein